MIPHLRFRFTFGHVPRFTITVTAPSFYDCLVKAKVEARSFGVSDEPGNYAYEYLGLSERSIQDTQVESSVYSDKNRTIIDETTTFKTLDEQTAAELKYLMNKMPVAKGSLFNSNEDQSQPELCSVSWKGGFTVTGDEKSIQEVRRLIYATECFELMKKNIPREWQNVREGL